MYNFEIYKNIINFTFPDNLQTEQLIDFIDKIMNRLIDNENNYQLSPKYFRPRNNLTILGD